MEQTKTMKNTISKPIAIDILKDVRDSLIQEKDKEQTLRTINTYKKNIEISINPSIQRLARRYKRCFDKHGENNIMTIVLAKIIDKKMKAIFTK